MLSRWEPQIYAIFRIVIGFLFFSHGTSKLLGWPPSGMPGKVPVGSIIWFSGVIELVGGFLIIIGLFGSIAAFICSGEMAVAYFMAHASHGAPDGQQGRAGRGLLFCVPLHRCAWLGDLERRRRDQPK